MSTPGEQLSKEIHPPEKSHRLRSIFAGMLNYSGKLYLLRHGILPIVQLSAKITQILIWLIPINIAKQYECIDMTLQSPLRGR